MDYNRTNVRLVIDRFSMDLYEGRKGAGCLFLDISTAKSDQMQAKLFTAELKIEYEIKSKGPCLNFIRKH